MPTCSKACFECIRAGQTIYIQSFSGGNLPHTVYPGNQGIRRPGYDVVWTFLVRGPFKWLIRIVVRAPSITKWFIQKKTLETAHTISYDYLCPGGHIAVTL